MKLKIATMIIALIALLILIPIEVIAKETIPVSKFNSNAKECYFEPTLEEKLQQAKAREENERQEEEARLFIEQEREKIIAQKEAEARAAAQAEAERIAEEERLTAEAQAQVNAISYDLSMSEYEAKEWIAMKESGGDYNAVSPTGKYIGRYQLTYSYLNGDYSIENQEAVANAYVMNRYGSWVAAQQFWQANGWY